MLNPSPASLTQMDGCRWPLRKPLPPGEELAFQLGLRQAYMYTSSSSLIPVLKFQPNKSPFPYLSPTYCPFVITWKHDPRWGRGNFSGIVTYPSPFSLPLFILLLWAQHPFNGDSSRASPPYSAWTPAQTLLMLFWRRNIKVGTPFDIL